MRRLEFGWYLPTNGDTIVFNDEDGSIKPSLQLFEEIIQAAEAARFSYILIPVIPTCWEAYVTSSYLAGRTKTIKPLIAARPGYINPVLLAKMISTFDQITGGRIAVNLIAGQNEAELLRDGIRYSKEERYALMDEEVSILKSLWTSEGPIDHEGQFHTLKGAWIEPKIHQKPHPPFYLGGGSMDAWRLSARHSDVHLFWGDSPERIGENIRDIKRLAGEHGRADEIGFGMRLQIVCRESEDDAWVAARELVSKGTDATRAELKEITKNSAANIRVQELAKTFGEFITPHLWTGITKVRSGAGIAVVGNPEQCAAQLQEFIDAGCHSFCLSGFPHAQEATRFNALVRPLIERRNPGRCQTIAA